jgi:hypothetical protein
LEAGAVACGEFSVALDASPVRVGAGTALCDCADLFTQAPSIAAGKGYQKVMVTSFLRDGYVTLMVYSFVSRVFRISPAECPDRGSDCGKTLDLAPDHYTLTQIAIPDRS